MTVPYVPPGQDATVFYGVKDFQFRNNTGKPILIWSQKADTKLYIALYGFVEPPQVTWHHTVLKRFGFWTRYKKNPSLAQGEEKVLLAGQEGLIVRSWVTVAPVDGPVIIKKRGVSFYSPGPRVIETPGPVRR
jgi:vancomycin resistance protein YoaR